MVCSQCHKDMPDRYEQFNGHTIAYNVCLQCELENHKKMDAYPKRQKSVAKKKERGDKES
jgi:hypothetical protein